MEGVCYRGRVMIEMNMEIGKLPTQRYEEIKIVDLNKLAVRKTLCIISYHYTLPGSPRLL